eukprot:3640273-Rhodomonas_salina.1
MDVYVMTTLGIEPFGRGKAGKVKWDGPEMVARLRAFKDLKKEHSLLSDYAANSCVKWAKDPDNAEFIRKGIIYVSPKGSSKSVSENDSDFSDTEQVKPAASMEAN